MSAVLVPVTVGEGRDEGVALPRSDNEVIEVRQAQELADSPADVQEAAAAFPELKARSGRRGGS